MLKRALILFFILLQTLAFAEHSSIAVIEWVGNHLNQLVKDPDLSDLVNHDKKKSQDQISTFKENVSKEIESLLESESGIIRLDIYDEKMDLIASYPAGLDIDMSKVKSIVEDSISSGKVQVSPTFFNEEISMFIIIASVPIKSEMTTNGALFIVLNTATFESD